MTTYKMYKHKRFIDVAVLVTGIISPTPDTLTLCVEWHLQNHIRTVTMGITDFIRIKKSDLGDWIEVG